MKLKFNLKPKNGTVKPKKVISKKKKITIIVLAVLLIFVLIFGLFKILKGGKKETVINTAIAQRGDIELTISGTGTVEANEQYSVTSLVKGEIISSPFEEGQIVKKGDLLYKIDTTDIENNIERSKLSLEKTQNSYNQNLKELNKLNVTAPIFGTITEMYVEEGDSVGSNTKIADITDNTKMLLTIPFIDEHINEGVYAGVFANVTLNNTNDTVFGTVTRVKTGTYVNDLGVVVRDVEIEVDNPGAIKEGDKATAMVGDVACNDLGTFKNYGFKTVVAEVSGTISNLNFTKGDIVNQGDTIVKLVSESLEQNMTSTSLSLRESQLSLQNTYNELDNYNITSPISGTVIQKTSKAGDTLDNTNNSTTMAVIADMSKILFTMNVDELDISKIEEGQEVKITADALEDVEFTGYVETVSIVGTSSNGVTTYPVTIVINEPDGLIPGMNVSATIIVEKKENVIIVPVSAVRRGNIVAVKGENTNIEEAKDDKMPLPGLGGGIPDGFTSVSVKTGISDDNFIEITSGIEEGDEVWVPATTTNQTTNQQMTTGMPGGMGGGMPGGMGGGMPSGGGGMPGGGMPR